MPAEAPLFLMYTSGTTGRPKGCEHSTGGYLSYVTGTSRYYQDIHPDDTYWCFADIGWITGHSYIVYGPLSLGTTSVMYEGVPTYPDAGRPWRIAEQLGVDIFHTAPTTIRMLRKLGPEEPAKYSYHFKTMTTVGEPIEPDVWRWYHSFVGKGEAAITDTWWQTENGGFLGSTLPGLQPMKPGSCGPGVLGIFPVIYDENGEEVPKGSGKAGNICIRNPWPGSFQTIWGQPERYVETYYAKYNKDKDSKDWHDWPYFAGDGAVQAADGYFRILGRVDDVINVAGHRLGTKEIESAAIMVEEVAEAAAVPVIDELRGKIVEVYVALKPGFQPSDEVAQKVSQTIVKEIGSIARPKNVWIVVRHAKDALGQDHAPGDRQHLELRRRRRCDDAREPRDRRRDPPPRAEREARARRDPARALREREAGDRSLRPSGMMRARRRDRPRRGFPRPLIGEEAGALGELAQRGRGLRATAEPADIPLLERGPADQVSEAKGLVSQPREHRHRSALDLPAQLPDGGKPLARRRVQILQQQRELPDEVLLGHRSGRARALQ